MIRRITFKDKFTLTFKINFFLFTELCLRSVVDCSEWSCLSSLTKLKRLDVYRTHITTAAVVSIVWANPSLEHLNLGKELFFVFNVGNQNKSRLFKVYFYCLCISLFKGKYA